MTLAQHVKDTVGMEGNSDAEVVDWLDEHCPRGWTINRHEGDVFMASAVLSDSLKILSPGFFDPKMARFALKLAIEAEG